MAAVGPAATESATGRPTVTQQHLAAAFDTTRPSVSPAERQRYDRIHQAFAQGRGASAEAGSADGDGGADDRDGDDDGARAVRLRPGQRITLA